MKTKTILIFILISIASIGANGQSSVCLLDTLSNGSYSKNGIDEVLVDKQGNTYFGGYYYSSMGGNYTGSLSFYLNKYNSANQIVWQHMISPTNYFSHSYYSSYLTGFDVDDSGNVYVTGNIYARYLDLDTISIDFYTSAQYNPYRHIFVAKFNSAGSIQWLIYSEIVNPYFTNNGMTADLKYVDDNNIHISMSGNSEMIFADGTLIYVGGDFGVFTVNSDGNYVRGKYKRQKYNFLNIGNGSPSSYQTQKNYGLRPEIRVSNSGKIFLTSLFNSNQIYFDSKPYSSYTKNSNSNYQTNFVASLDTMGWVNVFRGMGSDIQTNYHHPTPFAIDNYENVYLATEWSNNEIIIQPNVVPQEAVGAVVSKFNKHGNLLWYCKTSESEIYNLHTDNQNRVTVVGLYNDSIRINPPQGSPQTLFAANAQQAVYAYSLSADGDILWMTDIHNAVLDADYRGSYINDCGQITILAKSNGITYMDSTSIVNNNNHMIIAKYSPFGNCSVATCKYVYLENTPIQYANCNIQNVNINWASEGINYVNLYYSLDSGITYSSIVSNVPDTVKTYNWTPAINIQDSTIIIKISGVGPDSIYSNSFTLPKSRISGIKTIGGQNPDYLSFNEAINALKEHGICNDVVFKVRDGYYREQMELLPFVGMGTYNVTFERESYSNQKIVINDSAYIYSLEYFVKVYGVDNITFRNIEFQNRYYHVACANNMDKLDYSCNNILFDSCTFNLADFLCKGLTIKNSYFTNYRPLNYGFLLLKGTENDTSANDFKIYNNVFSDSFRVDLSYTSNVNIHDNIFRDGSSIVIYDSYDSINIYNNRTINTNLFWINAAGDEQELNIYNNFISVSNSITYNVIILNSMKKVNIFNNSFRGSGTSLINCNGVIEKNIFNNSFVTTGNNFAIDIIEPNNYVTNCDYNNYSSQKIIKYNNVAYSSLSAWQAAFNMDAHSTNHNPMYVNDTILRIHNPLLENTGTPLSIVKYDIDGEVRNPFNPDIGADEFSLNNINYLSQSYDISIYPNPASDKVLIEFNTSYFVKSISVYNSQSKLVYSVNLNRSFYSKQVYQLNIQHLKSGVYFIQISSKDTAVSKKLTIIK